MRVLLCVPAYKPALDYGGPVTKIALLTPALQRLGVDVEIVTADFGPERSRVPAGHRNVDGIAVHYRRRLVSRAWVSVAPGAGPIVRNGFDIVHCFGLRDGLVASAAFTAGRNNIPVALEPMGMAVPRIRSVGIKQVFDRVLSAVIRDADVTIATSELEAGELRGLHYPNVVVRPNPIAVPVAAGPRPAPRYDICYIGRLHDKKRLTDIVAALASDVRWCAVIAGPDGDGTADRLRDAAARAGVADRLEIRGWVSPEERQSLMMASRCFVLPSATENFGNAAAEAIALGTPAVVTDQCGVATLVRETGAGVVARVETGDVIRAVRRVLGNESPALNEDVLAAYSPKAIAQQQVAIYESIIR